VAAGVASLVFLGAACDRDETSDDPINVENSSRIDDGTTPFGPYEGGNQPLESRPAEGGDDDVGTGDND
jgi:hypothetical protein